MRSVLLLAFVSTVVPAASTVSAQDASLQDEVSLLQRVDQFKVRSDRQVTAVSNRTLQQNLVYVRVCKTGSTSTASAIRRIADHNGMSGVFEARAWPTDLGEPGIWAQHGALDAQDFGPNPANEPVSYDDGLPNVQKIKELTMPYFLTTVIRDPAGRALSKYYFNNGCASVPGQEPIDKARFLREFQNDMFRYIRMFEQDTVDDIFNHYGVVGLTERLDESLVVLAASLKVPLSDVLYLSAKNSSAGFVVGKNSQTQCEAHPSRDEEPQDIKDLLDGEFRQANALDYQLVERANSALDAKIAEMNLTPAIKKFQDLLAKAQKTCEVAGTDKELIQNIVDCYVEDEGCNYRCLNQFDQIGRDMCEWCD